MPLYVPPPPPPPMHCIREVYRARRPHSVGHVDSDTYPLRVHWSDASYQASAPEVLAGLELAWSVQVEQLGFRAPVSDGDDLDVYLDDVGEFQAWVEPVNWADDVQGDGYNSVPTMMVIDGGLPSEWIASYTAHEFNHVLQYATDASEPSLNFWEATATAAQAWTLSDGGSWDYDVYAYQEAPWAPSLLGDSYTIWYDYEVGWTYEYGAGLWVVHLDYAYGTGDGALGPALWDAAANEGWTNVRDHLDAIESVTGDTLPEFLDGLAETRWLTGDRWTADGLPDAADWGEDQAVPVARTVDVSDLPTTVVVDPMLTGQSFVLVTGEGDVHAQVTADGVRASAVVFPTEGGRVVAVSNAGPAGLTAEDEPYAPTEISVELTFEPIDGDTDPDSDPPDEFEDDVEVTAGACGCTTGTAGAWWVFALVPWWTRRRR